MKNCYNSVLVMSFILSVVLISSGCASVASGKNQAVTVQTVCGGQHLDGASCTLKNSKGEWRVNTPGSVTIHKAYGELVVSCEKEGLTPSVSERFDSSANGGAWGNIILGGVVGYAIDAGNGAGFDYPQKMTVAFNPPCEGPPEEPLVEEIVESDEASNEMVSNDEGAE